MPRSCRSRLCFLQIRTVSCTWPLTSWRRHVLALDLLGTTQVSLLHMYTWPLTSWRRHVLALDLLGTTQVSNYLHFLCKTKKWPQLLRLPLSCRLIIPRWAKFFVLLDSWTYSIAVLFWILGNILYLPTPDPARRPGITPPLYSQHFLIWSC